LCFFDTTPFGKHLSPILHSTGTLRFRLFFAQLLDLPLRAKFLRFQAQFLDALPPVL
jgi:hypothetical protein